MSSFSLDCIFRVRNKFLFDPLKVAKKSCYDIAFSLADAQIEHETRNADSGNSSPMGKAGHFIPETTEDVTALLTILLD